AAVAEAAGTDGLVLERLHAHLGFGVFGLGHWREAGLQLASLAESLPSVTRLNLGGGLGVPYQPGEPALDLSALAAGLAELRDAYPRFELLMEPGRYLVGEAGVLLTRVRQVKRKGRPVYVSCDAGMHTLLRPALYEAWHPVVNLSRLEAPRTLRPDVVGPVCESADCLARDRLLPGETAAGDFLLVDVAGAYGAVMASDYNLRGRPREVVLDGGRS